MLLEHYILIYTYTYSLTECVFHNSNAVCVFFCFSLFHFIRILFLYFFRVCVRPHSTQQILFHLSQITPRRHTIRLKESKSNKKITKSSTNEYERLCQESLSEAVRNFQACTHTAAILKIPITAITKQKPLAGPRSQTNSAINCLDRLENHLRTSYVSKNSFAENKAEPMLDAHETVRNIATINHPNSTVLLTTHLIRQLSQPIFRNSIQIRGFRTQRNIESQLKRNPSFMSRLQQYFGK